MSIKTYLLSYGVAVLIAAIAALFLKLYRAAKSDCAENIKKHKEERKSQHSESKAQVNEC